MTDFSASYDAIAAVLRDRRDRREGALLAVFLDREGRVLLPVEFNEGTANLDELFLRYVVALVTDVDLDAVVLAVARASGRPTRPDRVLWRELQDRLADAPTHLVDLLIVGDDQCTPLAAA